MSDQNKQKKKVSSKQVVAIIGVILLLCMYLITLVAAFIDTPQAFRLFSASLCCTIIVPVIVWIYAWMYGRFAGKSVPGDPDVPGDDL